jgi:hypothetical protein
MRLFELVFRGTAHLFSLDGYIFAPEPHKVSPERLHKEQNGYFTLLN